MIRIRIQNSEINIPDKIEINRHFKHHTTFHKTMSVTSPKQSFKRALRSLKKNQVPGVKGKISSGYFILYSVLHKIYRVVSS